MNDLIQFTDELRSFEVKNVILSTKAWGAIKLATSLNWTVCHFSTTAPGDIPTDRRGVYTFVVQPSIASHPHCSYLLYVGLAAGQAGGFHGRFRTYRAEYNAKNTARPLVNRMINKWYDHLWFCYAEVADAFITGTEDELLTAYLPPMNTEFPASISAAMRAFA